MSAQGRWAIATAAAALAFLLTLPGAAGIDFHNTAEPLEALVLREMFETGDWTLPRRNGSELPSKPPFFHWIGLVFAVAFGRVDELVARLPSMVGGALTVGLVAAVGTARFGVTAGALAALVLATSPEWARWSVFARTDVVFAGAIAASLLLGDRWLRTQRTTALFGAALAAGLATLAKGPAGMGFPVLILGTEIARRRAWGVLKPGPLIAASALALLVAGSWYAAALARGGAAFFEKQILAENVYRFLPAEGGPSRSHGMLYYLPTLFVGLLPWSLVLPHALIEPWRKPDDEARASFGRFATIWVAIVVLVCTAASGKRSNYVLPLYPAAALLIGAQLAGPVRRMLLGGSGRSVRVAVGLIAGIGVVAGILALAWALGLEPWSPVLPWLHRRDRALVPLLLEQLGEPPVLLAMVPLAFGIVLGVIARKAAGVTVVVAGAVALLGIVATSGRIARQSEANLKSSRSFADRIVEIVGDAPLHFFEEVDYGALFYLERHVPVVTTVDGLSGAVWMLAREREVASLRPVFEGQIAVAAMGPRTAPHRNLSRFLLVRLEPPAVPGETEGPTAVGPKSRPDS